MGALPTDDDMHFDGQALSPVDDPCASPEDRAWAADLLAHIPPGHRVTHYERAIGPDGRMRYTVHTAPVLDSE